MKLLSFPELKLNKIYLLRFFLFSIFSLGFLFFYFLITKKNHGFFSYVLDDPYIHLSLARNFADNLNWGINFNSFSSSSSSPLYTILLSIFYFIFPDNHLYPLFINYLSTICFIILLFNWFSSRFKNYQNLLFIFLLIFVIPMLPLVFTGMEHTLHLLTILLFFQQFLQSQTDYEITSIKDFSPQVNSNPPSLNAKLIFLSVILAGLRYESLFFTFVFSLILLVKYKKIKYFVYFCSSLVIPLVFGIFSILKGWYFLPSSILIKTTLFSQTPDPMFFIRFFIKLFENPVLSSLFFLNIMIIFKNWRNREFSETNNLVTLLFLGTLLAHLQFAQTGWFYRYEAYLIFMGIFSIIVNRKIFAINRTYQEKITTKIISIILLLTLLIRGGLSHSEIKQASHNIFSQQIQISHYLQKYYPFKKIALNDIGAPSYFTNKEIFDIWGIGNLQITKARIEGKFNRNFIRNFLISKNIPVLIVFREWFQPYGGIPHPYSIFAKLKISNNIICGSSEIYFFARNDSIKDKMKKSLKAFQSEIKGNGQIFFIN